jgi:hypothetical protein
MGMGRVAVSLAAVAAVTFTGFGGVATNAEAAAKYKFANCAALNKVYPHGVGKATAKDKTSGKRVTTFKKDTKLYKKIIANRSGLDRDKDGIACEKR